MKNIELAEPHACRFEQFGYLTEFDSAARVKCHANRDNLVGRRGDLRRLLLRLRNRIGGHRASVFGFESVIANFGFLPRLQPGVLSPLPCRSPGPQVHQCQYRDTDYQKDRSQLLVHAR